MLCFIHAEPECCQKLPQNLNQKLLYTHDLVKQQSGLYLTPWLSHHAIIQTELDWCSACQEWLPLDSDAVQQLVLQDTYTRYSRAWWWYYKAYHAQQHLRQCRHSRNSQRFHDSYEAKLRLHEIWCARWPLLSFDTTPRLHGWQCCWVSLTLAVRLQKLYLVRKAAARQLGHGQQANTIRLRRQKHTGQACEILQTPFKARYRTRMG